MKDDDGVNPYPLKGWRASGIVALTLIGSLMVFILILARNNMRYDDDPIIEAIYLTITVLGIAIVLSIEGRHLYLHRKWNIQHQVESKVLRLIVLCIALASVFWIWGLKIGLVGPA